MLTLTDLPPGADHLLPAGYRPEVAPGRHPVVALDGAGTPAAAMVQRREAGVINTWRLWVAPGVDPDTLAPDLLAALRRQARDLSASASTLDLDGTLAPLRELLHDAPLLGIFMRKAVSDPPRQPPSGYGHRPMTTAEYDDWLTRHIESYAQDGLARSGGNLDLARERSRADFVRLLPDGLATADQTVVVLTQDGGPVGTLWVAHHREGPETFGFDFEIHPEHRGLGLGRAGMAVGEQLAAAAGDETVALHVFGDNLVAQNLYRSEGFLEISRTVDLVRRS